MTTLDFRTAHFRSITGIRFWKSHGICGIERYINIHSNRTSFIYSIWTGKCYAICRFFTIIRPWHLISQCYFTRLATLIKCIHAWFFILIRSVQISNSIWMSVQLVSFSVCVLECWRKTFSLFESAEEKDSHCYNMEKGWILTITLTIYHYIVCLYCQKVSKQKKRKRDNSCMTKVLANAKKKVVCFRGPDQPYL